MRVNADRERCVGSGLCLLRLPEVFDQDEDGIVLVLDTDPPAALLNDVAGAVDACPSRALAMSPDSPAAGA
jgi:ferredoxin